MENNKININYTNTNNLTISIIFYNILHCINYNNSSVHEKKEFDSDSIIINKYDNLTQSIIIKYYNNLYNNINFNKNELIPNIEIFFNKYKDNLFDYNLFSLLYNDYINNYQLVYINNINNYNNYFQPHYLYKYYENKQKYKYYNYILYYFHIIIITLLFITFNIIMWVLRFNELYYSDKLLDEFKLYIALAKACAGLININILFILLPSFINLLLYYYSFIINFNIRKNDSIYSKLLNYIKLSYIYLPYYLNFKFHYLCGIIIFICSIIHSISHIFSFSNIYNISNCCIWNIMNLDRLNLDQDMDYNIFKYLSITSVWTGILLILIIMINIILIILFTFKKIRHSIFHIIHIYSFIFWFILLLFHGYDNWLRKTLLLYFVLPILIIYIFNKKDKLFYLHKVKCIKSDIYKNKFIRLTFFKNEKLKKKFTHSNMDININIPKISLLEWHTFSIVTSPEDDCIILYIKILGKWTNNLNNYILNNHLNNYNYINLNDNIESLSMYINGPSYTILQYFKLYKVLTFVANGIGINLFISFIRDYIYKIQTNKKNIYSHIDIINIIWIINDHTDFQIFNKTLNSIHKYNLSHKIKLYTFFTYNISPFNKNCLQFLQYHIYKLNKYDIISGLYLDNLTILNKPNLKNIFQNLILLNKNNDFKNLAVFFCGNTHLKKKLLNKCYKYSNNTYNVKFHFYNIQ